MFRRIHLDYVSSSLLVTITVGSIAVWTTLLCNFTSLGYLSLYYFKTLTIVSVLLILNNIKQIFPSHYMVLQK